MRLKLEKLALGDKPNHREIEEILKISPRSRKRYLIKDAKLRTFITSDDSRDDLVVMFMTSIMERYNQVIT